MNLMQVKTVWGAATDVGKRRNVNEDTYLTVFPIFLVADGMGGYTAGDVASRIIADEFSVLKSRNIVHTADLQQCFKNASLKMKAQLGRQRGGTTVAGVAVSQREGLPCWLVFNIGDSRVYRYARNQIVQLTNDHSVVQELIDNNVITPEQALTHNERNVVTRAVDTDHEPNVDYWWLPLRAAERIIICSDGLVDEISDEKIALELSLNSDCQQVAERLVALAVENGGRDNVTVVVIDVIEEESEDDHDTRPRNHVIGGM